jgi:hypothetical protein
MRIDETSGIVLFQGNAMLTYKDWQRETAAAIAVSSGSIRRVLSDRRGTTTDYEPGIAQGAAEFIRAHAKELENARWAILTTAGSAAHQTAKAAEGLLETSQVLAKVFVELAAALRWLLGVYEDEEIQRLEEWVDSS